MLQPVQQPVYYDVVVEQFTWFYLLVEAVVLNFLTIITHVSHRDNTVTRLLIIKYTHGRLLYMCHLTHRTSL